MHASPDVRRLVRAVARGLRCCQEPQAAEAGLGGTYFFRSEAGAMVAIIKPCDEEPLAPNNPKASAATCTQEWCRFHAESVHTTGIAGEV